MATMEKPSAEITPEAVADYQAAVWRDPIGWIYTVLGAELWGRQAEIAEAVRDHPRVAVRSANAIGKSFLAACLTTWFLEAHCPGYVITTSSAWRGIEKVLWPEIRRVIRRANYPMGGELLKTEWRRGDQWAAFGVSADQPENFAGFRTEGGVFVIVDEASAIEPEIMEAIIGLSASAGSRILLIGNPLRPSGPFYDAFKSPAWKCLHIGAMECPNVIARDEIIPGLATAEWVEERKLEWGESSPAYQARVLGEFPSEGEDCLIPLAWAEHAMETLAAPMGEKRMGVDVARFGNDRTVLAVRHGRVLTHIESYQGRDLMQTCGVVIATAQAQGIPPAQIYLDDGGLGGGVTDRLREQGFPIVAVNFGAQAREQQRFANCRSEMYWHLRDNMNPENPKSVQIPKRYSALAYECASMKYGYTSKGQIQIESKDNIRKRIGRSPDLADALALTFAPTRMAGMTRL